MNKAIFVIFLIFIAISCSKKDEVEFEAFSPEAFAYDIGDAWEVNATINVRGFTKTEVSDELSAALEFSVDLSGPDSVDVKNIFVDSKEVTGTELIDVQLEAQFELDYTYPEGTYTVQFNVIDIMSGELTSASAEFELKN